MTTLKRKIIGAKTSRLSDEIRKVTTLRPWCFEKYVSSYTTYQKLSNTSILNTHAGSDAMPIEYFAPRQPDNYACCNYKICSCSDLQDNYDSYYDTTEPYDDPDEVSY